MSNHAMRGAPLSKEPSRKRVTRWLPNALITGAVVVGMMGLARVSASTAWGIAAAGLAALCLFFYLAGRPER